MIDPVEYQALQEELGRLRATLEEKAKNIDDAFKIAAEQRERADRAEEVLESVRKTREEPWIHALSGAHDNEQRRLARDESSKPAAEDVDLVRAFMANGGTSRDRQGARAALSRLAAKAHGYEALLNGEQAHEAALTELARVLGQKDGEDTLRAARRVATERDAAVADSAALLTDLRTMHNDVAEGALRFEERERIRFAILDRMDRPYHGAALLEQHRKEMAAFADRLVDMTSEARDARAALGTIWALVGGMSDPASIAKSVAEKLAQARNDGLEEAARKVESADDGAPLQMLADDGIRAMKTRLSVRE